MTNTKSLFVSVLKALHADVVCDIGSRDGDQSLLFRHVLPEAAVLAFEANPFNFEAMQSRTELKNCGIAIFPFAIADRRGAATFHIADVDYTDPNANRGTSSLLQNDGQKVKKTIEVETHRIDEFILEKHPAARRMGLWIDVEGAEHAVLSGISGIAERVVAIHVETSNEPRWQGQRPLGELEIMLAQSGFVCCGVNFGKGKEEWGDAVFVQRKVVQELGWRFALCRFKGVASYALRADHVAVFLKTHARWLYRALRWLYLKTAT